MNVWIKVGIITVVSVLGFCAGVGIHSVVFTPPPRPSGDDIIQQVVCEYGGYLSFVGTDVTFRRWWDGSMEFTSPDGYVLLYRMHEGETCGWNPRITRDEANELIGGPPLSE
jgi:hypothetical protein